MMTGGWLDPPQKRGGGRWKNKCEQQSDEFKRANSLIDRFGPPLLFLLRGCSMSTGGARWSAK